MTRLKGSRRQLLIIGLLGVIVAVGLFASVLIYSSIRDSRYHDITHGPDLKPTTAEISLTTSFPPANDWSGVALAGSLEWANQAGATAVIVLDDGRVVAEWGDTSLVSDVHSVRKSIVSVLFGIAIERGLIERSATLAELGIDDVPPLTEQERQASINHILASTAGIYHPSVVDDDEGSSPERGSHQPGEAFYYNNWGFNAAGGIFEELTGLSLGEAFLEWIAQPTEMQDFEIDNVTYETSSESRFPAYRFWMSTRDLARFGLLIEQDGRWEGQQIVPAAWIEESTQPHTSIRDTLGYAFMWWTDGSAFFASGTGGQRVYIDPTSDLVVVVKVNTGPGRSRGLWWDSGPNITYGQFTELVAQLDSAAP